MTLCRLIYSSYAAPNLSYLDLVDIMEKSEKNNKPVAITGMLCYGNSMFLQVLEGDRKLITQTYNRIIGDHRHFDSEIIDFSEIESRVFGEWSMKVVQLDEFMAEQVKKLLLKYSGDLKFPLGAMNPRQSLSFMVELSAIYALRSSTLN
jgi:Sensors of blue-light using FAD